MAKNFYFSLSFFLSELLNLSNQNLNKFGLGCLPLMQTLLECVERVTNEHLFSKYVIENSRSKLVYFEIKIYRK